MTSLAPVPSESATCANCSAPLVADQRYCLSCGQPCSPVRLAFLDVLEAERPTQLGVGPAGTTPVTYTPYPEPAAGPAWLRRYSPFFAVASVLLLAMIVGLLVGHWVTQSKTPVAAAPEVVKVEDLGGTPLASATGASTPTTAPTTSAPPTATGKSNSSAKSEEEKEKAEAKAEEKAEEKTPAKAPAAKTLKSTDVSKLEKSHGKQHEAELNKLSTKRIKVE
jgi:hypothetical protein